MTETKPKPRLIVEQQDDGTLVLELYINGSRSRRNVTFGFEAFEIKEALAEQKRSIEAQAARKAQELELAAQRRHSQVWSYVAQNHGVGFANKTVNGVSSLKLRARVDGKPTASDQPTLKQMLDLIG
jgi:hypothetical protein